MHISHFPNEWQGHSDVHCFVLNSPPFRRLITSKMGNWNVQAAGCRIIELLIEIRWSSSSPLLFLLFNTTVSYHFQINIFYLATSEAEPGVFSFETIDKNFKAIDRPIAAKLLNVSLQCSGFLHQIQHAREDLERPEFQIYWLLFFILFYFFLLLLLAFQFTIWILDGRQNRWLWTCQARQTYV